MGEKGFRRCPRFCIELVSCKEIQKDDLSRKLGPLIEKQLQSHYRSFEEGLVFILAPATSAKHDLKERAQHLLTTMCYNYALIELRKKPTTNTAPIYIVKLTLKRNSPPTTEESKNRKSSKTCDSKSPKRSCLCLCWYCS